MERFLLNSTVLLHRLSNVSLDEVSHDDGVESSGNSDNKCDTHG